MLKPLMDMFEAASSAYAEKNGIERDADWHVFKLQEEIGELTQVWNRVTGRSPAKGRSAEDLKSALADETADLIGHVLLFARDQEIDLAAAIERKWQFRPESP
jgi:NTP pyrophosphatase (non-canonical NTP hydrolase)